MVDEVHKPDGMDDFPQPAYPTRTDPTDDVDAYLRECVRIEPLAIQEEYVRLPADLAYWNAKYAEAQREFLMSKVDLDVLERELYPVVRQELETSGQRVTEKMIEAGIGQSSLWTEAKQRVARADADKAKMYGVLDAVRTKRDMLVSLGAHLRAEMEHDPTLRAHSAAYSNKMGFEGQARRG